MKFLLYINKLLFFYMLKIVALFCLISFNANAIVNEKCVLAAEKCNQEYMVNIAKINRQKNYDIDAANMAFKSKVNAISFNYEKKHTPIDIYNKNVEQKKIHHRINLMVVVDKHKNNTNLLNDGLKNDLKKIQNGDC